MPSIGQSIIQGLATGFSGDQLATDLARQKLELTEGQRKLKAEEYDTSADKAWSKAITDLLAGQQTPVAPPVAPQPGQASVPMTQGTAGVPATPTAPGLGGPRPPPPAPPQVQPAGGTPASATLSTLGQTAVPQAHQPPPIADPLNASNILAKIKADNPNLDDGVMSSIVNKHLMPYLDQQQQNRYKQFQDQLDLMKLSAAEQDKANTLYFRYQQLQEQMDNAGANRELRLQLAAESNSIRQQLVDLRQPLVNAQIQELEARRAKELQAKGAIARLDPRLQAHLTALEHLETSLTSRRDAAENAGDTAGMTTFDQQLQKVEKDKQDILDKADQLDAQGAPQQPASAKNSGDTSSTSQLQPKPVPADKPVDGVTPEQWAKMKPAQRVVVRDTSEAVARINADTSLSAEQKKAEIAAVVQSGKQKYDALGQ